MHLLLFNISINSSPAISSGLKEKLGQHRQRLSQDMVPNLVLTLMQTSHTRDAPTANNNLKLEDGNIRADMVGPDGHHDLVCNLDFRQDFYH